MVFLPTHNGIVNAIYVVDATMTINVNGTVTLQYNKIDGSRTYSPVMQLEQAVNLCQQISVKPRNPAALENLAAIIIEKNFREIYSDERNNSAPSESDSAVF